MRRLKPAQSPVTLDLRPEPRERPRLLEDALCDEQVPGTLFERKFVD